MFRNLACLILLVGSLIVPLPCAQLEDLSANDKDFIEFAGEFDLTAIHYGQLAQLNGSARIKEFGRMIEQAHTADLKQLNLVADKVGGVAPNTLDDVHKSQVKRLHNVKAKSFDHQFLKAVVNDHENALVSFKREAENGLNQHLQAYAKAALPHLEEHVVQARKLAR